MNSCLNRKYKIRRWSSGHNAVFMEFMVYMHGLVPGIVSVPAIGVAIRILPRPALAQAGYTVMN